MANKLIDSDFFKAAAGYAKAIANTRSENDLTCLSFMAGLVLARRFSPETEEAEAVSQRLEQIGKILSDHRIELPDSDIDKIDTKMPLVKELKDAISRSEGDLGRFIDDLIIFLDPVSLSDNHFVELIMPYLVAYLPDGSGDEMNGDQFAAAAFSAYEAGVFGDSPGLSSHFSLNRIYLDALVDGIFKGRRPPGEVSSSINLKLVPELLSALRNGHDDTEKFVSALNPGLSTGVRIIYDRAVAYHEAGHAVVSWALRPEVPVNRILVKHEKDYNGITVMDGASPHYSMVRRHDYLVELCILLAGRAAQSIKYGLDEIDTGASSDLESATSRAWSSIAYFGLDPEFGPIDLSIFKEPTGWLFDEAHKRLQVVMKEAAERTNEILAANWIHVEIIAAELIAKGEVNFEEFVRKLATGGLKDVAGAVEATSVAINREVTFARSSGSHQTPEGAVRFEIGDAIVQSGGESWPVPRAVFDRSYRPLAGNQPGEDGSYQKLESTVRALRLSENSRIDMISGRGVLLGKKGDWIVDYGNGELSIVNREAFDRIYRVTNQEFGQ